MSDPLFYYFTEIRDDDWYDEDYNFDDWRLWNNVNIIKDVADELISRLKEVLSADEQAELKTILVQLRDAINELYPESITVPGATE